MPSKYNTTKPATPTPPKKPRRGTKNQPIIPIVRLDADGQPIVTGYLNEPKAKPSCNNPKSDQYGHHAPEAWGSDPRFERCTECGTLIAKAVDGLPPLSKRALTAARKRSKTENDAAIRAASTPLFPDDPGASGEKTKWTGTP